MLKIAIPACELEVVPLEVEKFYRATNHHYERPIFSTAYSFEDYINEKRDTEDALRNALSRQWTRGNDFEVGSDENIAFTMCGGIYSPRIICREYIETLFGVLRSTRKWENWAYSTSIELEKPIEGMWLSGFVLQRTTIFVEIGDWTFDFVKYFSRPRAVASAPF